MHFHETCLVELLCSGLCLMQETFYHVHPLIALGKEPHLRLVQSHLVQDAPIALDVAQGLLAQGTALQRLLLSLPTSRLPY